MAQAPYAEGIAEGIVRYHVSEEAARQQAASVLVLKPGAGHAGAAGTAPSFVVENGGVTWTVDVPAGTSLYGAGAAPGAMLRNGQNLAAGAAAWVMGVRADGTAFGVLADTTWGTTVDLTRGIVFKIAGGVCPVVVIDRDGPLKVVQALADATGHMEMPPRWAIGYQHARASLGPESRVREVAGEFRTRGIPCDGIWLETGRAFTVDSGAFPDPAALNTDFRAQGFHTVWTVPAGVRAEPGYGVYDSGTAIDAWVKAAGGSVFQENGAVFPDFTRQPVREWWAGLCKDLLAAGAEGVNGSWSAADAMPAGNLHGADAELGGPGPHARYRGVCPGLMAEAMRDGVLAANPKKRPFVLGDAGGPGGQRFAASSIGEIAADWAHLDESVAGTLSLGLSGQPFAGADIGGSNGNGPEGHEGELFARWMGVGALLPFARGYAASGSINKEPWAFGEQVERTSRQALERRYRLMP